MRCRSSAYLAACCVLVAAGSAWAGPTHAYPECTLRPSDSDVTAAKGAFQAGTVSFNEADYDRAILYWEDAYRRDCTATLLLQHLGRAYEGAGNLEQAVIALRTFIERSPESPERAQVQRRIEVFEQKLAEDKQKAAAALPPAAATTQPGQGAPPSQKGSSPTPAQPPANEGKGGFPWAPAVPIAVGGVAAVVGTIVFIGARQKISDIENYTDPTSGEKLCKEHNKGTCPPDQASQGNDARTRATIGTVVGVGGLAVAGAGVLWLILDSKSEPKSALEPRAPKFSPWVGQNSAGLIWQGHF